MEQESFRGKGGGDEFAVWSEIRLPLNKQTSD